MKVGSAVLALLVTMATGASAQFSSAQFTSADDRRLIELLVAREDSREGFSASDERRRGLTSTNPHVRAFTVRGLGRLEQPEMSTIIGPLLADEARDVRTAAAHAMAQSVARPLAAAATPDARASLDAVVSRVRAAFEGRLSLERDPSVRGALLESIGRLPQGSATQVGATAELLAQGLTAQSGSVERRGAARGLLFLSRKREARVAGAIPARVTDRLFDLLGDRDSAVTSTDRFAIAYTLWNAFGLDERRSATLIGDADPFVRDRAVVALARSSDLAVVRDLLRRAMTDQAPIVRFRAVNVFAQKLRTADGCMPLVERTADADMNVALAAADALSACSDARSSRHLDSLANGLRDDDRWHLPAHAFAALAAADSARARLLLPRFVASTNFFVRMYAAAAASVMGDLPTLMRLSRDPHPNVQSSAVEAITRIAGHAADSIYLRALRSDDNQLIMAAAAGLVGSTTPGVAQVAADLLSRRSDRGWDTDRDGNVALRDLAASFGHSTGPVPAPTAKMQLPTFDDLVALERATARIEMLDGSAVTMRLHPFDAPTNALRFARLAKDGAFDGLTFHRVAPFFVVQGPGPNANEYSAPDRPFARDELGVSNVRGTVGLSTRGRDTGDGQIYVNTVHNIWLDHDYTVMGTIISGLEAFDRMQEGARIRRVTIRP